VKRDAREDFAVKVLVLGWVAILAALSPRTAPRAQLRALGNAVWGRL